MTPLPRVRKRTSYSDVKPNDLTFALFHDRIMPSNVLRPQDELPGFGRTYSEKASDPGDFLVVEDPQKPSTWHLQVKRNGTPDHGLMGSAWAALHSGFRGNPYQGPNKAEALAKLKKLYASEQMDVPATKDAAFAVFKDSSGGYRWVMLSSNSFRDRDHEIVSTKALHADVARADNDKRYGPLRWWHVGVPFGPGLDLGDCDFNAMVGKMLVESGTFRSPAIASAHRQQRRTNCKGASALPTPLMNPITKGCSGIFGRFERSLVPRGKAANPFTQLYVQEISMDETKIKELAALLNIPVEQVQSPGRIHADQRAEAGGGRHRLQGRYGGD